MKYVDLLRSKTTLRQAVEKYDPKSVLVVFEAGLGDALNFLDIFEQIKQHYKKIDFKLAFLPQVGYNDFLPGTLTLPSNEADKYDVYFSYDLVVKVAYLNKENAAKSKPAVCIEEEIGLTISPSLTKIPVKNTRIVGIGSWSITSPQLRLTHPEYMLIRRDIIDAGFIPLEIHFSNYIDNHSLSTMETTRAARCTLDNLFGSISACQFFLGVNSGPLFAAMRVLPLDNVACLDRLVPPLEWHTDIQIKKFRLQSLQRGDVANWLLK